jgi:hypothetical protein
LLGAGAELLATDVDANGKIIVIDARTGKKLRTVRCLGACCRIVAPPDGSRFMYTGWSSPYVHHPDRSPRSQPLPAYQPGAGRLSDLAASPSPDTFAACGELAPDQIVTWLIRFVGGAWSSVRIGEHPAQRVAWSADGKVLVLAHEKRLTALAAGGLVVGAAVARPPALALDIEVPDPAAKARKAKTVNAARDKAAAELVGLFGNVMIAPEESKASEASVFNAKCDAWFAEHPGESIASVAMLIAGALAANNPGVTRDAVYPMVLGDLVRVRGGAG